MNFLVGPVFSRRLGRSLGVDLLRGECTFLCPYCEVRVRHVDRLKLFEFRQTRRLYEEYRRFCEDHSPKDIDSVTFSGTGEPTLISNLGEILHEFREMGPYSMTVITNGSLLWMSQVRAGLREADLVVPSLDAVTESAWRRVNRPHPELTLQKYLDGIRQFCADYPGRIWMEVLLVKGSNDRPDDIDALGGFLHDLRLDRVQIGTVDRPPAASRASPVPPARLAQFARRIRALSGQRVELMTRHAPSSVIRPDMVSEEEAAQKIIQSVRLRPQTQAELRRLIALPRAVLDRNLRALRSSGRISRVRFGRRIFLKVEGQKP